MSSVIGGVGGAILGAGLVGAGATVIGGVLASNATSDASNAAIQQQQSALQQQATLSQPYRDLGSAAIPTYQNLLTGGGAGPAGIEKTLQSLPGYQATLTQGTEAAQRAAGASGLNLSGNQVAAVQQQGAVLADQTYNQRLQELLQPINTGQAAAAGQAANVGGAAANISNALIGQGNTQAGIDANTLAGLTKTAGTASNQYLTQQTLANLIPGYGTPGGGGGAGSGGGANMTYPGDASAGIPTLG